MGLHATLTKKVLKTSVRIITSIPERTPVVNRFLRPKLKQEVVLSAFNDIFNNTGAGCQ
jgi:hypothetical protein